MGERVKRRLSAGAIERLRKDVWPHSGGEPATYSVWHTGMDSRGNECVPLDRQAAMVTWKGEHYEPAMPYNPTRLTWTAPPRCNPVPKRVRDLTGMRRGRMVIVGYLHAGPVRRLTKERPHKWLARCDCGLYEVRDSRRFWKSAKRGCGDACARCVWIMDRQRDLKRRDLDLHGAHVPTELYPAGGEAI